MLKTSEGLVLIYVVPAMLLVWFVQVFRLLVSNAWLVIIFILRIVGVVVRTQPLLLTQLVLVFVYSVRLGV